MKLIVFGATGKIGGAIVQEALRRGHGVTAVARHVGKIAAAEARLHRATADVSNANAVARVARGHEAIVSAVGPAANQPADLLVDVAHALVAGARKAGVKRVLVVGGAGSLRTARGVDLLDSPDFPADWRAVAIAHRNALNVYRQVSDLAWTCVSPAALVEPGQRTGTFRVGGDDLLVDATGASRISIPDYAAAVVDELEHPKHVRSRFTVAY